MVSRVDQEGGRSDGAGLAIGRCLLLLYYDPGRDSLRVAGGADDFMSAFEEIHTLEPQSFKTRDLWVTEFEFCT
jgi:hypothetical protein